MYLFVLSLPVVFVELLVRSYFAIAIGPSVFLYGSPMSRHQERFDPKGSRARVDTRDANVAFHDNQTGSYSKYHPNQRRNDRDEFGHPIDVRINSQGFRGKDYHTAKQPGVIRVVTLGASSTFGFKEHDDKTYPSYMEQFLNTAVSSLNQESEQKPELRINGVEVINLGIPHLRSEQIYSLFLNEAVPLRPDFVTFYEGINDAAWSPPAATTTERTKSVLKKVPLATDVYREFRYRFLSVAFLGALISPETEERASMADIEALRQGKVAGFTANLQGLLMECRRNRIQLVLANQQVTSREGRKESRDTLRGVRYQDERDLVLRKLRAQGQILTLEAFFLVHGELMDAGKRWAAEQQVPFADVIGALDENRQHLVSWVHLNAAGNRVVAETLAAKILECIRDQRRQLL